MVTVATLSGLAIFSHIDCDRGTTVGTELLWTPFSLANAPYGGSAYYSADFSLYDRFGIDHTTLTNGRVSEGNISAGFFQTENWTIFAQSNETVLGPGLNVACNGAFGATMAPTNYSVSFDGAVLQGPGNTSNAGQPTTFTWGGVNQSATFANGFSAANDPPVSTCGASAKSLTFSSTSFDISVSIVTDSGPLRVVASVQSDENFTYDFPANGGSWAINNLQAIGPLTGPGLAFDWQPC